MSSTCRLGTARINLDSYTFFGTRGTIAIEVTDFANWHAELGSLTKLLKECCPNATLIMDTAKSRFLIRHVTAKGHDGRAQSITHAAAFIGRLAKTFPTFLATGKKSKTRTPITQFTRVPGHAERRKRRINSRKGWSGQTAPAN